MPQMLEIPTREIGAPPEWLIERMIQHESSGDPKARGKQGEIGLMQIMPQTARRYGVDPRSLFEPTVNKSLGMRILGDLLKRYKGNLPLALAAYNAGTARVDKGLIPPSAIRYVRKILEGIGSGVSTVIGEGAAYGGETAVEAKETKTAAKTPDLPAAVKLGDWFPAVGQFGGEYLGGIAGAAIPGAGESGAPEYLGAITGGAAGSALGAEASNLIRRHYNLPTQDLGGAAAIGGAGSAVGGAIPFVARLRKAASVARKTGTGFKKAFEEAKNVAAQAEKLLGMSPRVAKLVEKTPAAPLSRAYRETSETGLSRLGKEYDRILGPAYHRLTKNSLLTELRGHTGKLLELAGKPLRRYLQSEIGAHPMTVRREMLLLSQIRKIERSLDPQKDRLALTALSNLRKAAESDIDAVIGPARAVERRNLDTYYRTQIARFPMRGIRQAFNLPQAAAEILKSKKGDIGRVLEVVDEMRQAGQIGTLQRAATAGIFQEAERTAAKTPADRLVALEKAINKIEPEVFDSLFGAGARELWGKTAQETLAKHGELLKHPDEAAAIAANVRNFLMSPSVMGRWTHYLGHRALWGALMVGTGEYYGPRELAIAGGALIGVEGYEMMIHSPVAMRLYEKAVTSPDALRASRLLIAAFDAAARSAAETELNAPIR